MGTKTSKIKNSNSDFTKYIDKIATDFILSRNFQDMINLQNFDFCNKLTIMSSNKINENLNFMETSILMDRTTSDNIIYSKKEDTQNFDIKNDKLKQKYCNEIAKFYIKISHLFSVIRIVTNNNKKFRNLGFCHSRLNTIKQKYKEFANKSEFVKTGDDKNDFFIITETNQLPFENKESISKNNNLPELSNLYMDIYDPELGLFVKMSEKSKTEFFNDLHNLYKTINNVSIVPPEIKSFSDITFSSTQKSSIINNNILRDNFENINDTLLNELSSKIQLFESYINTQENLLLNIIEQLFLFNTETNEIIIHKNLNMDLLDLLIKKTRKIILNMYIGCDNDSNIIYHLLEQFIESIVNKTTERKIIELKKQQEELLSK
jgi:hypothetical protein